jgi:hypothetical protein
MQSTVMIAVLIGVVAFGVVAISVASALDMSSVPDKSYAPADRKPPQVDKSAPTQTPDDGNVRPECVMDSSMWDGNAPQPPKPDEVTVGSFACQT